MTELRGIPDYWFQNSCNAVQFIFRETFSKYLATLEQQCSIQKILEIELIA